MSMPLSPERVQPLDDAKLALFAIHDLKGAVHAVQGFLSVLLGEHTGPLTAAQHDFLTSAFITARRIERLVGDLQVFEYGHHALPFVPEDCDLLAILRICVRELEPTTIGLGICIKIQADRDTGWWLYADPIRIEQIIFNLLENAIHYSEPGCPVVVRLRQSNTRLLLVVENQVDDPASVDLKRAFTPFQRGTSGTQSSHRGLGIGLTVVKTLATARGGFICTRVQGQIVSIAAILPRHLPADQRHSKVD